MQRAFHHGCTPHLKFKQYISTQLSEDARGVQMRKHSKFNSYWGIEPIR